MIKKTLNKAIHLTLLAASPLRQSGDFYVRRKKWVK